MSLKFYDKAVYRKIHNLYDCVFFTSPEEAFKVNAKRHEGKVMMPFITIWRTPDISVNRSMANDVRIRFGGRKVRGLAVTLTYQIEVYATRREVCDGLAAEVMLEMFENPWVSVNLESMGEQSEIQFGVDVEDSISDNSDISSFEETNRYYRLSMTLLLNEALIYRVSELGSPIDKVEISFADLDSGSLLD